MSSILANKFEMNRISSWKGGSVALEKDESRKCGLENLLHMQRRYWGEKVQGTSIEKVEVREDTGAKLEVQW